MIRIVILAFVCGFACAVPSCVYENKDGTYNLSPLKSDTEDYIVHSPDGGYTIALNLCRETLLDACGPNCAACLQSNISGTPPVCLGRASTLKFDKAGLLPGLDSRAFFGSFTSGSRNELFGEDNHMRITFICDEDADAQSQPELVSWGSFDTMFHWRTQHACAVASLDCKRRSDCASCTADSKCTWCLGDGGSCVLERSKAAVSCKSFAKRPRACPRNMPRGCDSFNTCAACAAAEHCSWCLSSATCLRSGAQAEAQCDDIVDAARLCDYFDAELVTASGAAAAK